MPIHHIECAYCGRRECDCRYSEFKAGQLLVEVESTSAQGTLGDMRRIFERMLSGVPNHTRGAWRFSFTEFPDDKGTLPGLAAMRRSLRKREDFPPSNVVEIRAPGPKNRTASR